MIFRKSTIALLLSVLVHTSSIAQNNSIRYAPYNQSDAGTFMSLEYSHLLKNELTLNIGLLAHLNIDSRNPDRHQEYYLHKRFWAFDTKQALGLTAGLQKNICYFSNKKISLFLYEQSMFRYMGAKSKRYIPIDTVSYFDSSRNEYVHIEHSNEVTTNIRNLFSVENIIGLGISADISKKISFNIKLGAGCNLIFNTPKEYLKSNFVAEYSLHNSFGISYKF